MKKILSFVMALAMVTSLVATPKVALPNKSAKKTRIELTLPAVQKQQPQVKHVAKKNIARKAVNAATEITPEQALEIGKALADNATTDVEYRVVGIVSYANNYSTQYGNQTFSMSSDGSDDKSNFKAYQCYLAAPGVVVGDSVAVTGKILKYVSGSNTTIEIKQGTVEILGGDVPPTPPTPAGDVITPEQALEIGKALADNATTDVEYRVVGIVSYANNYSTQYGNQTFSMSSDGSDDKSNFKAYQCYLAAPGVVVGDSVAVTGKILKYVSGSNTTIEIKQGTVEILGGDVPPTPPTPTGDVEITGLKYAEAYYYSGYWDFDIYTSEDTYYPDVYFSANEEATSKTSIVGTYTAYYAGYWTSANDSVEADYENPVGTLTITNVEQGIYNFVGSFVGTDGKTYTWNAQNVEVYAYDVDNDYAEITLNEGDGPTPPTPGEPIYTTMNHPMVMDSIADFGWIYVSGENDDYSLGIQVNTDHLLGEFTNDDIEYEYTQMIDWVAYELVDIESVPSVVIAQVEDTLRFTVTIKATDGQVYVVTMNDFEAQPTGEETYVDVMLPEVYDATETEGWFQVLGYDVTGEYYASICVNTTNMFGTFADADMDWEYTGIYVGETAVQLIESSIAVSVYNVADTVVYRAEVLDVDGMKWIITMKDFVPTPTEIIDLVTVEAEGEFSAEYGDYYATGVTADGDEIAFDIYMDQLASGTFTLADVETYYSGIMLADGTLVEFYSADIKLTVTGKDVLIEAVIIGRDAKQYNITMEIAGGQPSGDHTIVIADYADVSFTTLDGAYIVASAQNGGSSAPVYNADGMDARLYAKNTFTLTSNNGAMTEIVFNISDKGLARQADIAVSAGEITSYDMTNAKVTWKGNATEVIFTVGDKNTHGTDAPSKAGQFDFTSIDIVTAATGLQDLRLNDNVKKFMYKGNVMINVNGVIYNVMGAKVAR
ncbi:MAG: hypothetical protein MJZ79_07795 [Paludibacteraceae bacterium]|nr:hypothetical protein [Paludibacteraceae bacterium]